VSATAAPAPPRPVAPVSAIPSVQEGLRLHPPRPPYAWFPFGRMSMNQLTTMRPSEPVLIACHQR
jgi:hypothetical protein